MILRFGCENFRSISEYQEVLLTAASKDDEESLFSPIGVREKVLPILAIYGANGSGKTNVITAIKALVLAVRRSASKDIDDGLLPSFKLGNENEKLSTTLDVDFICSETHYNYGFTFDGERVTTEWLYSFSYTNRMSRSVMFYRDITDEESPFYFGKSLKGKNKVISEITGNASLFLSVAAKANHKLLSEIAAYFQNNYGFRFNYSLSEDQIAQKIKKHGFEKEISEFLTLIDIGASRLESSKVEIDEDQKKMLASVQDAILSSLGDSANLNFPTTDHRYIINIHRENDSGKEVSFNFSDESLGTRALTSLLVSVFWVLKNGGVFIVDELESSLHTKLSLKIVEMFSSKKTNPHGAQIIFTTHETQLLNFDSVRRDEVWLTEKSKNGSTKISPLSDYSIDKRSNLRNGYLDGRFGAIPFLGLVNNFNIFEADDAAKKV